MTGAPLLRAVISAPLDQASAIDNIRISLMND
jgi:hypothetical protein